MQSPIFRRKGYVNEAIDFRVIGNSSAALDQQNYSNEWKRHHANIANLIIPT